MEYDDKRGRGDSGIEDIYSQVILCQHLNGQ